MTVCVGAWSRLHVTYVVYIYRCRVAPSFVVRQRRSRVGRRLWQWLYLLLNNRLQLQRILVNADSEVELWSPKQLYYIEETSRLYVLHCSSQWPPSSAVVSALSLQCDWETVSFSGIARRLAPPHIMKQNGPERGGELRKNFDRFCRRTNVDYSKKWIINDADKTQNSPTV